MEGWNIKKFIMSFLYSLGSLIISVNLLAIIIRWGEGEWQELLTLTGFIIIYGFPIILVSSIIGELIYRYYITAKCLSFEVTVGIYILLGIVLLFFISIFLSGIQKTINEFMNPERMQLMIFAIICSVTFFIKRNTYK
ncbi:hypothetical protein [Bacillus wiedmannii]|uniref:hypothetical protein n=2 Tax=Bacillus wiedmannii TaxID=1890302 RepID=UPI0011430D75|nr:hypothetical protein [Bacillus wiedmannii]